MRIKFYILTSSLVLLASLASLAMATLAMWEQCGGIGWTGSGSCVDGSVCTYSNDYYSQCLPAPTTTNSNTAALWGKCGGIGYTGPTGCPSGSSCVYVNDWYSQCQPSNSNNNPTATAPTTLTTQSTNPSTSASTLSGGTANLWEKCGGIGFPSTACTSGSSCVYVNDWYSQCQPVVATTIAPVTASSTGTTQSTIISTLTSSTTTPTTQSTTLSSTTSSISNNIGSTVALWAQCGGIGYTGATGCPSGSSCIVVNQWYYQCQPTSTPSTLSPVTSSSQQLNNSGSAHPFSLTSTWLNGRAYSTSNNNYKDFSHITIWIGSNEYFNIWWEGQMLRDCVANSITPVFYSYIIAFSGRNLENLQDCDVSSGPNLCNRGAQFIRNNRAYLVAKYALFAANIANITGRDAVTVWLIEPDFYQYYSDSSQTGGTLSGEYMRALLDDFVNAIKTYLPNAIISWDISPWAMQNMNTWWSFFSSASYIQLTHTSGGRASATSDQIKPNELTYSAVKSITGKPILTDCGYGVGGSDLGNCGPWGVVSNIDARMQNGVIGVSQANVAFTPSYWPNLP